MIRSHPPQRRAPARGFTMVESTISILIVGVMMVAALEAVGGARSAQQEMQISSRGRMFAEDLLSEIVRKPYQDTNDAVVVFGKELSELSGSTRSVLDDVDDYNGLDENPPVMADGSAVDGAANYRRTVNVYHARTSNVMQNSATATGIKRIHVMVSYKSRKVAELVAFRTTAWLDPLTDAGGQP